jgi:hypothetical protein
MIAIYDKEGRQQRRRAIYVGSIFFVNPPDILLTPRVHDFFGAQGGGSGGGGGTTITTALSPITMMGCGHDRNLQRGGTAAAAAARRSPRPQFPSP